MNIPYQNMEIEQIYTQLLSEPHTSIAICSAEEGEGVTSLALALAQRNLLAGHSTLVVDLNLYHPAIKSLLNISSAQITDHQPDSVALFSQKKENNNTTSLTEPQLVFSPESPVVLNGIIAPTKREHIMKLRQPGILEVHINQWLEEYDTVIIDTSPLNRLNSQNIPAERVAAACDGAILMVLAGKTSEASITTALTKLNNANAQLLGSVFNDRDNPKLKDELLREAQRLDPIFSWLSKPIKKIINNSRLLTLEI